MSYVKQDDSGGGGGGTPGGSDKDVQFNDGGSFGGDSDFTFDKTAGAEQVKISASSSTDLVKITQTGTGNAFLVEDETSPDSSPFAIDHTGKVGIGIAPGGGYALRTSSIGNIQAGTNGFMNAGRFTSRSNGSTSSVCFSRDIDQDTGMYFPGTNQVGFSTAGNERLRFGDSGQIGLAGANYGTSGQVLTSGGAGAPVSWQDAGGGQSPRGYIQQGTFTAQGLHYSRSWGCSGSGSGVATNQNPVCRPFFISQPGTVAQMLIRVVGGSFGEYRAGIYSDDGGKPNQLLGQASYTYTAAGVYSESNFFAANGTTPRTITLEADTQYWYAGVKASGNISPRGAKRLETPTIMMELTTDIGNLYYTSVIDTNTTNTFLDTWDNNNSTPSTTQEPMVYVVMS